MFTTLEFIRTSCIHSRIVECVPIITCGIKAVPLKDNKIIFDLLLEKSKKEIEELMEVNQPQY